MQGAGHGQNKLANIYVERDAVFTDAMVTAAHGAYRRWERAAACVFEGFAWPQQRLLAHYAQASHLLGLLTPVGDDPVTADDLGGMFALVGDTYGVCKYELLFRRLGLIRQVLRSDADHDIVRFHVAVSKEFVVPAFEKKTGITCNNGIFALSVHALVG